MSTYRGGRHEHGQNFLTDRKTIAKLVRLVAETKGPILEIGAGSGAITLELQELGRPITAVEIDGTLVDRLKPRVDDSVLVVHEDFLNWRLHPSTSVIVGNLPFHLTTAMLRRILHSNTWTDAVLLVQWEVARRRGGVGGATMMTAQWWPWIEFSLEGRVPAAAFKPRPSVDGGLLRMRRRPEPLVSRKQRKAYNRFVHAVFTGRGRGLHSILQRTVEPSARNNVQRVLAEERIVSSMLPKDLNAQQWVTLFAASRTN
ncbi:23S ribosomal RNA methyltransferase Erm [Gulosibacter molinativorax]|uniref:23S ribosomal RNA methyltransferase Erm n=1 Tax=Gulosibacter molinativorax TaxID=256821 RepID=A0ABT7C9H1_9MICO|nr:23S ribosomal RNA methyltransferase Erm [Gulosibacter molinativorax]MDJ1371842.1 23S ribosomal RNA methyltransferase Erm [Gulosibacter molinativorax]QUY60786.1 Dimethyladenosine transferase (RRNA methylation) [Gulosibacter molinativorax]